jgi:hypothetical protein
MALHHPRKEHAFSDVRRTTRPSTDSHDTKRARVVSAPAAFDRFGDRLSTCADVHTASPVSQHARFWRWVGAKWRIRLEGRDSAAERHGGWPTIVSSFRTSRNGARWHDSLHFRPVALADRLASRRTRLALFIYFLHELSTRGFNNLAAQNRTKITSLPQISRDATRNKKLIRASSNAPPGVTSRQETSVT